MTRNNLQRTGSRVERKQGEQLSALLLLDQCVARRAL